MKYISTRGKTSPKSFSEVLLSGLAPDGGLFVPAQYPSATDYLSQWRHLSYAQLAYAIISLFADDIPSDTLRSQISAAYQKGLFDNESVVSLKTLQNGIVIEGLSHGPTLAFKDIAMQLLGQWFEYVLTDNNQQLNILGATSGDTGSAAEYAMRNKQNLRVFMLSPAGKMSAFQRAQMYSLQDANIYNIAIEGMFDDCQDIVKAVQNDIQFKSTHHIGTINSINWARIAAQVVYYFYGYFRTTQHQHEQVTFCVPSGNFGNVCAGHIAKQMGLPIKRLIVATNENDVLNDFFQTGVYRPRTSTETLATSSPSMDISKASNLERFVFDLVEQDADKVNNLWQHLTQCGEFDLSFLLDVIHNHYGFFSGKSTHSDRLKTIAQIEQEEQILIDPHTADGIHVALTLREPNEKIICLETASHIKFADTIQEATGHEPIWPSTFKALTDLPQRVVTLPADADAVKAFISKTLQSA